MKGVVKEAKERIEAGSFFQILEYYKEGVDPALIEQVNQVAATGTGWRTGNAASRLQTSNRTLLSSGWAAS